MMGQVVHRMARANGSLEIWRYSPGVSDTLIVTRWSSSGGEEGHTEISLPPVGSSERRQLAVAILGEPMTISPPPVTLRPSERSE